MLLANNQIGLERMQRGAMTAAILRSRVEHLDCRRRADEERHRLGQIDCGVSVVVMRRGEVSQAAIGGGGVLLSSSLAGFIRGWSVPVDPLVLKVTATVGHLLTAAGAT